jgi:NAD(P)-dependent dehydrogenase (short-subunit alcohol dehydrogenase family)
LNKKTIIVTGAAGGLGSALAWVCAERDYNTVMLDCDRRGLETAYDRMVDAGLPEPALLPLDLATAGPGQYAEMADAIRGEFGGLNALVHCAARFEGLTPLEHFPPEEWLTQVQVNLNAAWLLSVHCLPLLRETERAQLFFMLEDLPKVSGAFWGAYGVCKHALRAMVEQWSVEAGRDGVRVLGIDPGPMRSALRAQVYYEENPADQPDPAPIAARILQLLEDNGEAEGNFVRLMESD